VAACGLPASSSKAQPVFGSSSIAPMRARSRFFGSMIDMLHRTRGWSTWDGWVLETGLGSNPSSFPAGERFECLRQVARKVLNMLDANGEAQKIHWTQSARPLDTGPVLHKTLH